MYFPTAVPQREESCKLSSLSLCSLMSCVSRMKNPINPALVDISEASWNGLRAIKILDPDFWFCFSMLFTMEDTESIRIFREVKNQTIFSSPDHGSLELTFKRVKIHEVIGFCHHFLAKKTAHFKAHFCLWSIQTRRLLHLRYCLSILHTLLYLIVRKSSVMSAIIACILERRQWRHRVTK